MCQGPTIDAVHFRLWLGKRVYTLVVAPAGLTQAWNYHSCCRFFKHTALIEPWWVKVWGSLQIRAAFAESAQSCFLSGQPDYCEALDQLRGKLQCESWKPLNITCHLKTIKKAACQFPTHAQVPVLQVEESLVRQQVLQRALWARQLPGENFGKIRGAILFSLYTPYYLIIWNIMGLHTMTTKEISSRRLCSFYGLIFIKMPFLGMVGR